MDYILLTNDEVLQHHGILGMKWGIRRYQNVDGSLTDAGRKRLGRAKEEYNKLSDKRNKYLANKPTIDTASALALDRYKTKQGELVTNAITTGVIGSGAAVAGGMLFGPYGAAIAGGLPVVKNLPKGIKLAIETAYNKIQYEDADKLRKAYEKSEKYKSEIDELEGKESKDSKSNNMSDMFRNGKTNDEIIDSMKKNVQTQRKYHDDEMEEYAKNMGYNSYREFEDAKYDKIKSMMNSPMMGNANKMLEKKFGINMSDMMNATQEASKEYDKNKASDSPIKNEQDIKSTIDKIRKDYVNGYKMSDEGYDKSTKAFSPVIKSKEHSDAIAKQMSDNIVEDILKWNKKNGAQDTIPYLTNKDSKELEKFRSKMENEVKQKIKDTNSLITPNANNRLEFIIDEMEDYDEQPILIEYDPIKKKVQSYTWA